MTFALVAASSVLAVLLTLGWAREFRLRRALQSLLADGDLRSYPLASNWTQKSA